MAEFEMNTNGMLAIRLDSGRRIEIDAAETERLKGMLNARDQKWTASGRLLRYEDSVTYCFGDLDEDDIVQGRAYGEICLRYQPVLTRAQKAAVTEGSSAKCFREIKSFFEGNDEYPVWYTAVRSDITVNSNRYLFYGSKAVLSPTFSHMSDSDGRKCNRYVNYLTKHQPVLPPNFVERLTGVNTDRGLKIVQEFVRELDRTVYNQIEAGETTVSNSNGNGRTVVWEREGSQIKVVLKENGRTRDYWMACINKSEDEALFDAVLRHQPQMSWTEITEGVTNGAGRQRNSYKSKLMEMMNMNETTATATTGESLLWHDSQDGTGNPIEVYKVVNGRKTHDSFWVGLGRNSQADLIKDVLELQPQFNYAEIRRLCDRNQREFHDMISKEVARLKAAKGSTKVTVTLNFDLQDAALAAKVFAAVAELKGFRGIEAKTETNKA